MTRSIKPKLPAAVRGLRARLLLAFVLIGVVPLAAIGVYSVSKARSDLSTAAGLRVEGVAVEAGAVLDRLMEARVRDTQAFAHVPMADMGPMRTEFVDIMVDSYDVYDLMLYADQSGTIVAANSVDHEGNAIASDKLLGLDVSGEEWFQAFRDGRTGSDVFYTDADANALLDRVYEPGRMATTFTAGYESNGAFAGVLHSVVSFDRTVVEFMHELEEELHREGAKTAAGLVIARDGTVLYSATEGEMLSKNLIDEGLEAASASLEPSSLGFTIEANVHGGGDLIYGYGNADGVHDFAGYGWGVIVEQTVAEATEAADRLQTAVIIFALVSAAIVAAIGFWLARGVADPVSQMAEKARLIAAGSLSQTDLEVTRSDELGDLATSFNHMTDILDVVSQQANAIGSGELSHPALDEELPGELGEALTTMSGSLKSMVHQLKDSAETLTGAATNLESVSGAMETNADHTSHEAENAALSGETVSANVTAVAAAVEEMNATIREVAANASSASSVAQQAVNLSQATSEKVGKLGESSQKIGQVIGVIVSIAEQTNLLALNATIEAARAGEAGKGFAVVASEVKELANQTATAAEEITASIEAIQLETGEAVDANVKITETIGDISEISTSIAAAVEQQSATTAEIGKSVEDAAAGTRSIAETIGSVATATQMTKQSSTEARANAEEMASLAGDLNQLVSQYR
ncbi:MAG: methyl-accepting chemotaxis protein [Actinomycetota bacterium]